MGSGFNVEDDEFNRCRYRDQRWERRTPVYRGGQVVLLEGEWVQEVDRVAHAGADGELAMQRRNSRLVILAVDEVEGSQSGSLT